MPLNISLLPGIGRPFNPSWTKEFEQAFEQELPDTYEFKPRAAVGVNYVPGRELALRGVIEPGETYARTADAVGELSSSLVERLVEIEAVNPDTARSTVDTRLALPLTFRGQKNGGPIIVAAIVHDPHDEFYKSRRQMTNERGAIRDYLRVPLEAEERVSINTRRVLLGSVWKIGPSELTEVLKHVSRRVPESLALGRIGVVRPDWKN